MPGPFRPPTKSISISSANEADGLARAIADLAALVAPAIESDRQPILIRLPQGVRPRRHTRAASHSNAWSRMPSAESSLAVAST